MLPMSTTILIVLNYSVQVYRNTSFVFIESFGLYWSQRKKPIIEAGVNLLLSLLLLIVFDMGINGVLIGTIGSSLGFVIWYEAFIIYKTVFEKRFIHFFLTFWRSFSSEEDISMTDSSYTNTMMVDLEKLYILLLVLIKISN
ncbi:hypothetical protein EfmJHP80_09030 [Enterococcus faecium]|nr:hypothetical protein EfmJHP80_09030 [Enterococcus faecium]